MKILIILILGLLLINCDEMNHNYKLKNGDYLVFGHFYGECQGEQCIDIFKLTNNRLYEDITDIYPTQSEFYKGNYVELDKPTYDIVSDLFDYFPEDLLDENSNVFGCPDCADQGGLYIEYNVNGTHKFWIIDQSISTVPTFLHEFISKVNGSIYLIKNGNNKGNE